MTLPNSGHHESDPELLSDFVTEATELLEQVDQDLVSLEAEPDNIELLNNVFRAMHTIKGSGSFLGLTELCEFTHAAEDALNVLRKGQAELDSGTMDLLLAAVDVVKQQTQSILSRTAPQAGPAHLVSALQAIGSGKSTEQPSQSSSTTNEKGAQRLELSESKLDLLPYMVQDLIAGLDELGTHLQSLDGNPAEALAMHELAVELTRSVEFFEVEALCTEMGLLRDAASEYAHRSGADPESFITSASRLLAVMRQRAVALEKRELLDLTSRPLCDALLRAVGLACTEEEQNSQEDQSSLHDPIATAAPEPSGREATIAPNAQEESSGPKESGTPGGAAEQTIRVDVSRLESLLNLMGELVLQKNRVVGISKKMAINGLYDAEIQEEFEQIASDLDRVAAELQIGVMKTRMQPMHKLFSRYPRVIRDLARMTGKKIDLVITGSETEVDKSVIEALGDPLVHILRNSADHGIEPPADRIAASKPEEGVIRLSAEHSGNHVVVTIRDDGRGIDPEKIKAKAIERELYTRSELDDMTDSQIMQIIFAPGFSTAEQVSGLSGRGVGMDVVRTNITKLNGSVEVTSSPGAGSCVEIRIPLTLAIMQAMMVKVGAALYALPLSSIVEIVRPSDDVVYSIHGQSVMRLRDSVLPLHSLEHLLGLARGVDRAEERSSPQFAIVTSSGDRTAGLLVDGLVGQQEVVIKPLDDTMAKSCAVSGATVRDDGGVSLIVDIGKLLSTIREYT